MNRGAYAIGLAGLVVFGFASSRWDLLWSARLDTAIWLGPSLPRLRNIGWPWWFSLVALAPGGVGLLSVLLLFTSSDSANEVPGRGLLAASGLALIVFGWAQVALIYFLLRQAEQMDTAQSRRGSVQPAGGPVTAQVAQSGQSIPNSAPASTPSRTLTAEEADAQAYKAFAQIVYPGVTNPSSLIYAATAQVTDEWAKLPVDSIILETPTGSLRVAMESAKRTGVKPSNFTAFQNPAHSTVQNLAIYKGNQDGGIRAYYGLNSTSGAWALSRDTLVKFINEGTYNFCVHGHKRSAAVITKTDGRGDFYVTTEADGEQPDNLLSLPNFALWR